MSEQPLPTFAAVRAAHQAIAPKVHRTPLMFSATLSQMVGARLALKAECLQKTGSFKARGVLNRLRFLTAEEKQHGLITASAGNHALALAWGAHQIGVSCTVVMPTRVSPSKLSIAQGYGAQVVLHGEATPQAFEQMEALRAAHHLTLIHPFDDPEIVAGQGTLGIELAEQCPTATKVIVGVGGGGLIGGVALALKQLLPQAQVYGVEPEGAAAMTRSRAQNQPVRLASVVTEADGLGAPYASALTLALSQKYVDEVVLVTDAQILDALQILLARCKLLVEPAGAAALAAVLCGKIPLMPSDEIIVVLSGGNIDLARLKNLL